MVSYTIIINILESFDFLIDGQLLKGTLGAFLEVNKWSHENLLSIFVIPRIRTPLILNSIPSSDWVSSISLSKNKVSSKNPSFLFGDYSGTVTFGSDIDNILNSKSISLDERMPIKSIVSSGRHAVVSHGHISSIISLVDDSFNKNSVLGYLDGHTDTVECASIITETNESIVLATGSYDKNIRISSFNLHLKKSQSSTILTGHIGAITGLSSSFNLSPNSIISSSLDGSTREWDLSRQEIVSSIPHGIPLLGISVSSINPNLCASPMADLSIRVWDTRQKFQSSSSYRTLAGHKLLPTSVVFSEQTSSTLYSVAQDGLMKAWDLRVNGKSQSTDCSVQSISCSNSSGSSRLFAIDTTDQYILAGGDQGLDLFTLGSE